MDDLDRTDGLARVDLPEHGAVHLPLAGLGGRAVAALLDLLLVGAITLVLIFLAVVAGAAAGGRVPWQGGGWQAVVIPLVAVAGLGPVGVPLIFELFDGGQTPGKRVVKLRVMSADGMPATPGQLFLRNVLRLVDFLPAGYGLGGIVVFASRSEQRLGDLVAGTVVVREDAGAFEELAAPGRAAPAAPDLHGVPDPLLRAVALLSDPERGLPHDVFRARRSAVLDAVRRHRPDLAGDDDELLWSRLRAGVGRSR